MLLYSYIKKDVVINWFLTKNNSCFWRTSQWITSILPICYQSVTNYLLFFSDGTWSQYPQCQASQCPPLPEVDNAERKILAGRGTNYGTVVNYLCNPGYQRSGLPVLLCQSNGTWSSEVPSCSRQQCYDFPKIDNGYVVDTDSKYFYGDEGRVECHKGTILATFGLFGLFWGCFGLLLGCFDYFWVAFGQT